MPFCMTVSKDRLKAMLDKTTDDLDATSFNMEDLLNMLKKEKIVYGLNIELLEELCRNPRGIEFPITIAEGKPKTDGKDAYLKSELRKLQSNSKPEVLNFRNVLKIPSVKKGQLLASVCPAESGILGMDVFSNVIRAKDGKPLKTKAGKNVFMESGRFYSSIDGQLSITNRSISVNPVFEVNGDIDLKTGNIDFIGNVIIRGNVPNGYEIKAGGDIRITGIVEGAIIEAAGNVTIGGGVASGNRGRITAGGNVLAAYFNQANVRAEQGIYAEKSILHSHVSAGESIFCHHASVIGGTFEAKKDIHIKELGNRSYTKTHLYPAYDSRTQQIEADLLDELKSTTDMISKLTQIERKLSAKSKASGMMSEDDKKVIKKQRLTMEQLAKQKEELESQLAQIQEDKLEQSHSFVYVYESVYPNTSIHFGKYTKKLNVEHHHVKFYFSNGEIQFEPIL
ncbi:MULTISPECIES: DUF342 domain-containing protein [unclassified Bacillus (in: firmicutes)]|uniref:DUF342 domain-containing protein n=1 Tax=unclassified Bacillus (in: firmicutes) TaxID=185979 RepID=UPI0020C8A2C2|nr:MULTISPECIES: FapA family protein [unclassified Bacillus (in: firmicutes)]